MSGVQAAGPRASAQEVAYDWLKRHICGLPRTDSVFLSESEIAAAANTSRTPVREALLRLETEGFVQIIPKRGIFVPAISDAEVDAAMQARQLLEDWCVRRSAAVAETLVPQLERLLGEQAALVDDPAGFIEADRAFHRAIVVRAGNPVLTGFYESLRERQVRMGLTALAAEPGRPAVVLDEHETIVAALRTGDPETAAVALREHLASTLHTLNRLR
ncbi:GntR family transcriptional regulator [Labedaea rhizosphaerae]|uniref:GntR family transcriptional regulator n=1 Tax=Labedaea rhizosphaerae TaxID=598644 RepID=A0A4R6SBU6_LABRH|nr:GntR family transcriptional regulator [Labedaea rhizosphaerae]TDP97529.1 GntR family transcriptional regulator [Labedaea rhizosphaerae]